MTAYRTDRPLYARVGVLFASASGLLALTAAAVTLAADPPPENPGAPAPSPSAAPSQQEDRLISLVLLLSEPRKLDEPALADAVVKAVGAPSHSKGAHGFCQSKPPYCLVKLDIGRFVISNINEPYFDHPEKLAAEVKDPKLATAIRTHRAWISIDRAEADEKTNVKDVYQHIGKIAAALAGPDTLAIYNPDTEGLMAYDSSLAQSLKGEDPLERFVTAPAVILIGAEDSRLHAAEAEAKQRWPEFAQAFREKAGKQFAVKGRIVEGKNAEYLWLNVTGLDDEHVHGTLANAPIDLTGLQLGQDLHIKIADVDDWMYVGADGQTKGGFTQKALAAASKP